MGTLSPKATLFYIKEIEGTRKRLSDKDKGFLASISIQAKQERSLNEIQMRKLLTIYERVTA